MRVPAWHPVWWDHHGRATVCQHVCGGEREAVDWFDMCGATEGVLTDNDVDVE